MNTWLPAYSELAREGKRRGCRSILTGGGGDEWLNISPFIAADMLRDLNVVGIYRVWRSMCRSFGRSRPALDHAIVSWEWEELFEVYRRLGMRLLQPFWDPDLIDMLYRTPPLRLISDGRTKGLLRASLGRRFPALGFERQRKVEASSFYP